MTISLAFLAPSLVKAAIEGRLPRGIGTRRAVIREWMALPRDKRRTEEQAAGFAAKAAQRHKLPRSRRDPCPVMMDWLLPQTGKP
jgi:hypothetical protein